MYILYLKDFMLTLYKSPAYSHVSYFQFDTFAVRNVVQFSVIHTEFQGPKTKFPLPYSATNKTHQLKHSEIMECRKMQGMDNIKYDFLKIFF